MKTFPLFIGLILIVSTSVFASDPSPLDHKFYFSNTLIEQNPRTGTLEITIKLFTDDLERALQQDGHPDIRLNGEQSNEVSAAIRTYLEKHFQLKFQGRPTALSYVGQEMEADLTICYFELAQLPEFNFIEVKNKLLTEIFPDQKNVMDIRLRGQQQTLIFVGTKDSEICYF